MKKLFVGDLDGTATVGIQEILVNNAPKIIENKRGNFLLRSHAVRLAKMRAGKTFNREHEVSDEKKSERYSIESKLNTILDMANSSKRGHIEKGFTANIKKSWCTEKDVFDIVTNARRKGSHKSIIEAIKKTEPDVEFLNSLETKIAPCFVEICKSKYGCIVINELFKNKHINTETLDNLLSRYFYEIARNQYGFFVVMDRIKFDPGKGVIYFNLIRKLNDISEGDVLTFLKKPENSYLLHIFVNLFQDKHVRNHTKQWVLKNLKVLLDHELTFYIVDSLAQTDYYKEICYLFSRNPHEYLRHANVASTVNRCLVKDFEENNGVNSKEIVNFLVSYPALCNGAMYYKLFECYPELMNKTQFLDNLGNVVLSLDKWEFTKSDNLFHAMTNQLVKEETFEEDEWGGKTGANKKTTDKKVGTKILEAIAPRMDDLIIHEHGSKILLNLFDSLMNSGDFTGWFS